MGTDSFTTTVEQDNLFVGDYPTVKDSRAQAISQALVRGTVLGKVLYGAVTAAAGAGDTGDGTCTALATVVGAIKPIVGVYVLTFTAAVTHGGVFKLVDPNGDQIGTDLAMTASTGVATVFSIGGITFKLTDGATDFIVGDSFDITVAAGSGDVKKLDISAVDGSGQFDSILLEAKTTTSSTINVPVAVAGSFRSGSLVFGGSTVVADVIDEMRDKNCYVKTATEGVGA